MQDHKNPAIQVSLAGKLIIDNFAGGGGTSEGLEQAFGRAVDIAINHDPEALAMHAINHPRTLHLCEDVWAVHPAKVTHGRPVGLVWLSPDCKHFSKAKGGTPVEKKIRGLAWVGMRWVAHTKPDVLMLENVEEFQDWGPLMRMDDGSWMPDPAKKGKTFESFVRQLRAHGYEVDWKELRACDQGAPTIRRRLFLIARRDGLPITWPEAEYAEPTSREVLTGKLLPYRTAAECIDFTLPANSIFDRKKELAENTRRRVAKGLWRHVLTSPKPFIVGTGPTVAPFVADQSRPQNAQTAGADEPLRTQCAQVKGGHFTLVAPTLAKLRGGTEGHMNGASIEEPLATISAGGTHHGLVGANLITIGYGEKPGQPARAQDIEKPLGTIVASNKHALAAVHLTHLTHHGNRDGRPAGEPLATITAAHRGEQAVVAACLEQANGGFYDGDGRPVDVPISTITSKGTQQRLITAYCVKYYSSGGQWQGLEEPMHTLPTKGRMGLVQTLQVPADCLAPDHRERAKKCAALLHTYLPEHFPKAADLVLIGEWVLVDITLRMLKPRELFHAQGFPRKYIIHEIPDPKLLFKDGVQAADPLAVPRIPLTATSQVRMCGNSVSPYQAKALALANFPRQPVPRKPFRVRRFVETERQLEAV
jgi:DNA (cytosine-5)-methyltransferase 1